MSKPADPRWADTVEGDVTKVLAPSSGKQDVGWIQEMPPFQIFNWLLVKIYRWIKYIEAVIQRDDPFILRSSSAATWNGNVLTFAANIDIVFRNISGAAYINRIAAGTLTLADGEVVVVRKDRTNASPVTLAAVAYGSLVAGKYSIVAESSLTATNHEDELVLFRRNGTTLEVPPHGLIYKTGASIFFGTASTNSYKHTEAAPSATWTVNHNLGTIDHTIQTFDASDAPFLPDSIVRGINTDTITPPASQAGTAILIAI